MGCCGRWRCAGRAKDDVASAAAFERLYVEHESELYRYLARRLDPALAEATVAEVFALAWQRFSTRDASTAIRTWLLGLALERLDARRDEEIACLRHLAASSTRATSSSPCPQVADALAELEAIDRDVLTLHVWADVPHESVADLTGLTAEMVHRRISGAFEFVRGRTSDAGSGLTAGNRPRAGGNHR